MQNPQSYCNVEKYLDLVNTVAKVEYSRLSSSKHLLEFSEIVNIGATAVYMVLSSQPRANHNKAYIATAIKWAIRNELRRRYLWYSNRQSKKEKNFAELPENQLRETVYEAILSIEEMELSETPVQIEDNSLNPEEKAELLELKKAIIKAMERLPARDREILSGKFFKNKKVREIAEEMNVSPSRITKIIQNALDKIKLRLVREGII